ncbi:MAG: phosphate acyltransferase PlsX [Firmicutes bacterium]|nr:phosphate acyltransferase PlsX [Bacillota bacterium]
MNIAVDAMGGDFAPREIVLGAVRAHRELGIEVSLIGDENIIVKELKALSAEDVTVVHAPETIGMHESPAVAVRRKRNSSIVKAVELMKGGKAQAMVSAGSTGAVMAASLLYLGRIKSIGRPAIATLLPNRTRCTLLLDAGANSDCSPKHLLQFGIMGSLYSKLILGVKNPAVGLLNIGEEETKGNELTLGTYPLLKASNVNFIGNVEGRDVFSGVADVIVCDGFVGNVVLKTGEGLATTLMGAIKEEVAKSMRARLGAILTIPVLKEIKRKMDYSEYGGAPLLGVNGITIIAHGSSNSTAIKHAIRMARDSAEKDIVSAIHSGVADTAGREVNYGNA